MYPNPNQHAKRRKKRILQGTKTVTVVRGKVGYGFTISGQNPCMLSCIVSGSPAEAAGLKPGDLLYFVNGQNVSRACHDDVVRMVGLSTGTLELQVAENYNSSDSSDDNYPPRSKSRYPNRVRPRVSHAERGSKYERAPSSRRNEHRENHNAPRHYTPLGAESDLSSSLTSQEDQGWAQIADSGWSKNTQASTNIKKEKNRFDANYAQGNGFAYGAMHGGQVMPTAKKITSAAAVVKRVPQVTDSKLPWQIGSVKFPDTTQETAAHNTDESQKTRPRQEKLLNQPEEIIKKEELKPEVVNSIKAVVGYIGSIETPSSHTRPHQRLQALRSAVRRLRVEKRVHTLVLMQVSSSGVVLTNAVGKQLAFYPNERIAFSGICPDDERFFGLVTLSLPDDDCSSYAESGEIAKIPNSSCHIFMIEPDLSPHSAHIQQAEAFQINCTTNAETRRCEEFPRLATSLILCIANLYRDAPPRKFDNEIVQSQAFADPIRQVEHAHSNSSSNNSNSDSGLGFGREEAPLEQNEQVCVVDLPNGRQQHNNSDMSIAMDTSILSIQGHHSPEVDVVNITRGPPSAQRPLSAFDARRGLNVSTSSEECWQQGPRPINKLTPRAMPDPAYPPTAQAKFVDAQRPNVTNTENLRQSMQRLLQARQQQLQEQNCRIGSDGESHAGDPVLSLSVADDGHAILEAAGGNQRDFFVAPKNVPSSSMNFVANSGRSAFQVPRPVSAPLVKHRIQNRPETVDLETLGKLSPRAFPHTSPTSSVFRSPSAPPAPFFPHRDSDSDDDEDDDEEDESEDDPYIRQILEQFKKDRKTAMDEDSRRFSEGFALSKKRDKEKHEVGNIQKWTKAGSLRRAQHTMLKQSLSHSHESLAVGEDGNSSNQKLITACSVNNIACQTGDQGLIEKSGRVASWAVNFEKLLKDPIGIGIFTDFLKKEFSEENVIFWKACEQYRQLADDHQRKSQAKDIYSRYLSTKASDPVNVDSAARTYSEKFLDNPTAIMFDVAQQQIFQLMRQDSYARFLKSDLYKNKLMEEMEGKVLEGTAEERKFSDSKKKGKGKENDNRRRSILPWKQNRKSVKSTSDPELKKHGKKGKEDKDKESNNNHQNVSVVSSGTTTTITTSSNTNGVNNVNLKKAPGPGIDLSTMRKEVFHLKELKDAPEVNFKFCRIVMPDGSTTVVCAKPGQTSRSVLSKLCEKRSISIASVDVFLLGSDRPLDLNEDISTLGSKEIVIERRVLFRLDFPNNKSIGVKAKPNRSIRDVFKPILSKYGFRIDNIAVHLIGSMDFLDLDMSVSDIENQRVVIITDVEAAEIMRQGAQPTVSRLPKAPPASRSKAGHFGTRGGSLEEITNKIFEDLMRGKSQLAHGFDELGVLELDKAKAHKNEEGRSLALFGLLRKESVPAKEASKTSKLKGKVTFSLPKNESKKKGSAKEGERLFEMLSSAQKMRLEEQRGVLVTPGELPSFLCEDIKTGCVDEDQNIVEEIHMKKIDDAQCGLNMFDDVAEISKAGFLEKKKHELFNYPRSTYSSNFTPRETNKINSKTPTSEKWKLHVGRNLHQDGVVTSPGEADTYFRMSPLVIDSKNATQSSDNNFKNNLSLNMRAPVASPENYSPEKLRGSPEGKHSVLLASPLPDKLSPNSISSPETPKTSLHYSNKNFTSVNQTTSYQTGKLNLATENKSPSPQILSPSKNTNMDFFHQQQAHELIKNEFNGKDNFSNINSFHSFGKSPGTTQTKNQHFQISNGTSDTREGLHSPDIEQGHHGRMIQHKISSPTRDLAQRALMSPRFELSPNYRRPDPPPYKKRSTPFTSPNIKPDTDNSNSTSQGLSPPIPVFSSPDTVTKRPGSNQPFTEQPALSPSVFQFVDNRNLLHSNHYQNSPHPILNSAQFILLPYQNTDQEEETVTFV